MLKVVFLSVWTFFFFGASIFENTSNMSEPKTTVAKCVEISVKILFMMSLLCVSFIFGFMFELTSYQKKQ